MAQFFKFLFASCLGTLVALFLLFFIVAGSIGAIAESSTTTVVNVKPNSVLHLRMNKPIPELQDNVENASFELKHDPILGLHDMLDVIETAKEDDNIKGIFLEPEFMMTGFTSTAAIRDAIQNFKESGKFVTAYSGVYSQGGYYLSSVADEVNLAPLGIVDWRGFSVQYPFFKDILSRIGVEYEVFYAGRYKSASEPYRRNNMSDASKEQSRAFLEEMYRLMLADVSKTRDLTTQQLRQLADAYTGIQTEQALSEGLVDRVVYREAVVDGLRESLGLEEQKKINFVKPSEYFTAKVKSQRNRDGGRIAVLIAEGVIIDGEGKGAQIGDKTYVKLIEEIADDEEVKAVVLRVNSPGGSAMASDHIWQALMDLKSTGKPLVVSMGSVAASGGYYIAAPADAIFAEPSTITGSIGVVSAVPQLQDMLKQKLGVHFDSVSTGPFATGINPVFDMSEGERRILQSRTDVMYKTFLSRVSEGRGMEVLDVDSVAQGRVWVGTMAKQIGLVDKLGGLDEAIADVAERANLSDYHTVQYPKPKTPWERLFEDLMDNQSVVNNMVLQEQLGELYPYYQQVHEMATAKGPQMRLPMMLDFK